MSVAFDTFRHADRLAAGNFAPEQSTKPAFALSEAFTTDLVTKSEFKAEMADVRQEFAQVRHERDNVRHEIDNVCSEIQSLRQETKAVIAAAKTDMVNWLVGTIGFQTVVIIGAVATLLGMFMK